MSGFQVAGTMTEADLNNSVANFRAKLMIITICNLWVSIETVD